MHITNSLDQQCKLMTAPAFGISGSTTSAIATAHAMWTEAKQTGNILGIIAFDLSAAFDTVDPERLLCKLKGLGIRGRPLNWFTSYMERGYQCVDWDGTQSNLIPVPYGVRQGSILGPILFLVMMSDLPNWIGSNHVGYADDVAGWVKDKDLSTVLAKLEKMATFFEDFTASNSMKLNAVTYTSTATPIVSCPKLCACAQT